MTAHQRWLEQPTADDDDSAELARRERLAQAVRESVNPVDQLIVKLVEESSWVTYYFPILPNTRKTRTRTLEHENLLIAEAGRISRERWTDLTYWNEANGGAMCLASPDRTRILELIISGDDAIELMRLTRKLTYRAFAEACVSAAEGMWP